MHVKINTKEPYEEANGKEVRESYMRKHTEEANRGGKWERNTEEEGRSCITSRKSFMRYFTNASRK